jgi:hypothetical protein
MRYCMEENTDASARRSSHTQRAAGGRAAIDDLQGPGLLLDDPLV